MCDQFSNHFFPYEVSVIFFAFIKRRICIKMAEIPVVVNGVISTALQIGCFLWQNGNDLFHRYRDETMDEIWRKKTRLKGYRRPRVKGTDVSAPWKKGTWLPNLPIHFDYEDCPKMDFYCGPNSYSVDVLTYLLRSRSSIHRERKFVYRSLRNWATKTDRRQESQIPPFDW